LSARPPLLEETPWTFDATDATARINSIANLLGRLAIRWTTQAVVLNDNQLIFHVGQLGKK